MFQFFASAEVNRFFDDFVGEKLAVSRIVSLLGDGPLSTAEISETLGLNPSDVGKKMNRSSRQGLVRFDVDSKRYTLAVRHA